MQFICHRCQLNQSRCTWNQHLKHSWTLPRYGFARKLFRDSRSLLRPGVVLNHAKWFKQVCWNSLVVVTQIRDIIENVTMCNRSLKQTAISLSSCEAEFHAASACAGELLGLAELFKELHYKVSVRLEMDSDSARHILQRRGPGGLKHIEIRCLLQKWIRDKRLSVSRVDTKNNTADLFTKHLDGLRTRALAKKLGLRILDVADGGTNVDMADGGTNGNDR